jgi:hypothetical protein
MAFFSDIEVDWQLDQVDLGLLESSVSFLNRMAYEDASTKGSTGPVSSRSLLRNEVRALLKLFRMPAAFENAMWCDL